MAKRLTPEERKDRAMSEDALQRRVLYRAKKYGWMVAHFSRARVGSGQTWATPVAGSAKGYPDLTLARDGVVWFVELKRELGRLSPEQEQWLTALGPLAGVWRPSDLRKGTIEAILRGIDDDGSLP